MPHYICTFLWCTHRRCIARKMGHRTQHVVRYNVAKLHAQIACTSEIVSHCWQGQVLCVGMLALTVAEHGGWCILCFCPMPASLIAPSCLGYWCSIPKTAICRESLWAQYRPLLLLRRPTANGPQSGLHETTQKCKAVHAATVRDTPIQECTCHGRTEQ